MPTLEDIVRDTTRTSYQYWTGTKTVTLKSDAAGGATTHTVTYAKPFVFSKDDVPVQHQGLFLKGGLKWVLPWETVPAQARPIKPRDIIVSDGVEYTVLSVDTSQYGSWYRCQTLNLAIALGYTDTLTLSRATWNTAGGVRTPTAWAAVGTTFPGKIVEIGRGIEDRNERGSIVRKYEIHCQEIRDWQPNDRILDQNGNAYTLNETSAPGLLDQYVIYTAERVR